MVDVSFNTKDDGIKAVVPPGRTGSDVFDGATGSWPSGAALALWVFVGLLAYLFIGNIASTFLLALNDVGLQDILRGQQDVFAENGNAFLGGNAIGLALGLGSVALLASWLDSTRPLHFLRLKTCNASDVVLSLAGLICLLPAVLGLGILNEKIPLPDVLMRLEEQQMELIEWFTGQGGNFALNMIFVVATPAIFEEVFFRGYVQRRAERGLGVVGGIILTGVIFGVFHLRLTQVLPLILLGCYLAYVTWRTGSLWIAVVLHFFNNGLALSLSKWGPDSVVDPEVVPWFLIIGSTLLFAACILMMHRRNGKEHRSNWEEVFLCSTDYEANLVRARLEDAGIVSVLLNQRDHAFNLTHGSIAKIRVMVPKSMKAEALALFAAEAITDEELAEAALSSK